MLEWLLSQKSRKKVAVLKPQCKNGNVEMWADICNYEGRYQVSSTGRVKSLARMRRGKAGANVPMPERIMALTIKKDTGRTKPYAEVKFRNGGLRTERCKSFLVHRLVVAAFITPLGKGDQVDHINGFHADNRVENLRVMHYAEHARIHPLIISGEFGKLGAAAIAKLRNNGWVSAGYERTPEHREKLRNAAKNSNVDRNVITGQFVPGPMKDAKGEPTRKALALKKWKC